MNTNRRGTFAHFREDEGRALRMARARRERREERYGTGLPPLKECPVCGCTYGRHDSDCPNNTRRD